MTTNILHDNRTEAERRYDAQRDGSYYQPGRPVLVDVAPADPIVALRERIDAEPDPAMRQRLICRMADLILQPETVEPEAVEQPTGDVRGVPIGTIDGCEVLADYMCEQEDHGDLGIARMTWNGMELSTDGRSYLNLPSTGDMIGDVSLTEWVAIKALAHTDIVEQLIALALQYPNVRKVSPTLAASAPPITVETWHGEDTAITYTDFSIGAGLTKVMFGTYGGQKAGIELVIGGSCINTLLTEVITLADVQTLRDNLSALLADPRVQTLLARSIA